MNQNFFPATAEYFRTVGRWAEREREGRPSFLSFTTGSLIAFETEGAGELTFLLELTTKLGVPCYAVSVDGAAWERRPADEPQLRLPDRGRHSVRWVLESILLDEDRWEGENGIHFLGVRTDGGRIFPNTEKKGIFAVFGDSVPEGYSVLQTGNRIECHSAVKAFPMVAAERLDRFPYVVAYGWSGILHPIYVGPCSRMIRWFSKGHRADPVEPEIVLLEHGANDESYQEEEFEAAYRGTVALLLYTFPKARHFAMIPIDQLHARTIENVIREFDGAVTLIPTEEVAKEIVYTDNAHPDAASAEKLGIYLSDFIQKNL